MKRMPRIALTFGVLLLPLSAVAASNLCQEASRSASMAAQDYRNAVGKMKTSCNSSYLECEQARALVNEALQQVNLASASMSTACVFEYPVLDDLLPFTSATVLAAIDLVPESVAVPCDVFSASYGEFRIGCPNSWMLNIPKSNFTASNASDTSFTYSGSINVSATVPIAYELRTPVGDLLSGSCNITVGTATGVPIAGTATFSSSLPGGYFNRLQMQVDSIGVNAISQDGCGVISAFADIYRPFVESTYTNVLRQAFTPPLLCGVLGPELFGPCP